MEPAGSSAPLTFLFTDIEASTRAWENEPAAMSLALARHDELLQTVVKGAGGTVFKHTGDGVCAAFPTAAAGTAAALEAQRGFQSAEWAAGDAPLRVRMALHSGIAEQRDGDFFGPPLNRAARLLATAHGGQVVLSLVTAELVREALPPGAEFLDLGEHRLADLSRPERVFQLSHPDLPRAFPALRSLTAARHNLPVASSSFIGREQDLAAVADLLASARLVTLVGIGGVGKTRLALQVAAGSIDHRPDGVFLVDLAPLADPDLVAVEVGRAIGMTEPRSDGRDRRSMVDGLGDHLRERSMLLVVDNCEHVIDAVARLVDSLLPRCPDVAVLATSREPLGVGGEVLWRVPSLPLPPDPAPAGRNGEAGPLPGGDAVAFFCERARAVDSTFTLTAGNAAGVARICRRLDGIPLALELAAARIGVLSPDQVADRLDDCFRLLSVGPRTAVPRQQTFRATLDWSYDLLPAPEQVLLQRLSVFAGNFDLTAAEGVTADGRVIAAGDVLDLLGRLVDKSLVTVGGQGGEASYRLLETVRQYAAEKLAESGGEDDARHRHGAFYLGIARRYVDGDPFDDAVWLGRVGLSRENLRVALDWALARDDPEAFLPLALVLSLYWVLGGYFVEGRARLEEALGRTVGSHSRARIRATNMLGLLLAHQGELDRSLALHQEALETARSAGETVEAGVGAFYVGNRVLHRGDPERAAELFREAIGCLRSLPEGVAWNEMMLGWVALAGGDRAAAGRHFETALALAPASADNLRAHVLGGAALLAAAAGDGQRAEALAREGVEAARALGLQTVLVMTLTRMAEVAALLGRWEPAHAALVELFSVLRNTGGRSFLADALELAALVQDARGHPRSAAELLDAGDGVRRATGETSDDRPVTPLLTACRTRVAGLFPEPGAVRSRDVATVALRELERPVAGGENGSRPSARGPAAAAGPTVAVFRRVGKRWVLGYGDARFELPDAKGLGYLARLLAEPDREVHVLDLVQPGGAADGGDAGPLLDEAAKSAYRRRILDLQAEIAEAESWNDPERAARAEAELDAVTRQLAAGVGLGGRDRRAAAAAERARVSVRKAITASVAQIRARHTDLGLLLATTVKTGTYCRYTPDPRLPIAWEL